MVKEHQSELVHKDAGGKEERAKVATVIREGPLLVLLAKHFCSILPLNDSAALEGMPHSGVSVHRDSRVLVAEVASDVSTCRRNRSPKRKR